ncbi:ATP/GTP-binding protein, partial [Streptococcus danieliae]|nr:ATP/GTP-binding protein [Streptococcus danieliae]
TTTEIDLTRSVDFDISAVRESKNKNLLAAVQIVCWSYGQAAISAAKRLAAVGLAPQRNYLVVMDELWSLLEIDPEMIHHIDSITRL